MDDPTFPALPGCISRRGFLLAGGSATLILGTSCGFRFPGGTGLEVVEYPRVRVASVSEVKPHRPLAFSYPDPRFGNFLVRLEGRAAEGVGPDDSIVAFSSTCTHMGGPLAGTYRREHALTGPCPLHLTTFDLRRHGMVASGHATESLPQVRLEVVEGEIWATGMMGLIYGLDRDEA